MQIVPNGAGWPEVGRPPPRFAQGQQLPPLLSHEHLSPTTGLPLEHVSGAGGEGGHFNRKMSALLLA